MKIRHGFVSNSSSSSFIVAFPKGFVPTVESVREYVFKDNRAIVHYDHYAPVDQAVRTVFDDMTNQNPNNDEAILEALGGWMKGHPDLDDFRLPVPKDNLVAREYDWDAYQAACDEFFAKVATELKAKWADQDLYVFSYSDNDGSYFCALEHGGTFDAVPHLQISHH
jgi:hypothetical protein